MNSDQHLTTNSTTTPAHEDTNAPARQSNDPPLARVLNGYVGELGALASSLPLIMAVAQLVERDATKKVNSFLEQYAEPVEAVASERAKSWNIPVDHMLAFRPLDKRFTEARTARKIIPRTYLIALVSQFDAFLGKLIRALFDIRPELLNTSEKTLGFAQLLQFSSLEETKEYVIEKEIEGVLRESHSFHFEWLERKCDLPLRKDLPTWPRFIEITERRHLFVHTGGTVSSQYLRVCREQGVRFDQEPFEAIPKVGDELHVSGAYFRSAYRALHEIGVKLTHVLWRKLNPPDRKAADSNLIDISYDALVSEDHVLAQILLDFATETIKRHSSEDIRRRFVINRAQAYKWGGEDAKARAILDAEDWSAVSDEFKICLAVLRDDFGQACKVMRSLGPSGKIRKTDYRDWPIFKNYRQSTQFLASYESVFGEPFSQIVIAEESDEGDDEPGSGALNVSTHG